jgi:hypothetical protein
MTREEKFKEELKALLKKYDAEICLEDSGRDQWQPDYMIAFYGNAKWDKDGGGLIDDGFEFTGRYFDGGE